MQDQLTEPTGMDESWLSLPLTLSPEAERLTGADYEPMLYVAAEQRYIRLSHGAARLLDALDGGTTAAQILSRVTGGGDPVVEVRRRQTVLHTIDGLRQGWSIYPRSWSRHVRPLTSVASVAGADPEGQDHSGDRRFGRETRRSDGTSSPWNSACAPGPGRRQRRPGRRRPFPIPESLSGHLARRRCRRATRGRGA